MSKVKIRQIQDNEKRPLYRLAFVICQGCNMNHCFQLDAPQGSVWTFNGDLEKPTFSPSMLVFKDDPKARCHSFVIDGNIQYLADCFHELKNQTIPLPEFED